MTEPLEYELPVGQVDVVERGCSCARQASLRCEEGKNLDFSISGLEAYFFSSVNTVVYDALLLAAAVEYCDRVRRRPVSWAREIDLSIPVHDPDRWISSEVNGALHDALNFLTGDRWHLSFTPRTKKYEPSGQGFLNLDRKVKSVIPFSNGMDSCIVSGIFKNRLGGRLVCVRLASRELSSKQHRLETPFTAIPYRVHATNHRFVESSGRSRGFKFALVSGLAAYLAKAHTVIVPESGQGALGPTLIPVGQTYTDFRCHPLFARRMSRLLHALLEYDVKFEFPQIWKTKGETLAQFMRVPGVDNVSWQFTRSCWQSNRQVSVNGRRRQCGICAACMLRRLAVHAAGLSEPLDTYVWENLGVSAFEDGVAKSFRRWKITSAMREHAIGGTLYVDHLAEVRASSENRAAVDQNIFHLSSCLGLSETTVRARLNRLLSRHESEWRSFLHSLGQRSFIKEWVGLR